MCGIYPHFGFTQINTDAEDESLVRYKQQLGLSANADSVAPFPNDKRVVIVKQLTLVVPDREDKVLDLTMPLEEIKNKVGLLHFRHCTSISLSMYFNLSLSFRNSCSKKAASSKSR